MVYRFQLTYDEIINTLGFKFTPTKGIGYSLKPNKYQTGDINKTLKNILPNNVELSVSIDEEKSKSNVKIIQTLVFTNKISFILY